MRKVDHEFFEVTYLTLITEAGPGFSVTAAFMIVSFEFVQESVTLPVYILRNTLSTS